MAERILVVDDEVSNRELPAAILAEDGFQVELAVNGAAALAQATAAPPALILLDLMMPGMTGLEACRRLKEAPATSAIPIIVVTALGEVRTKEAALTSGADEFVVKPVRPEDLRTRVRAMLKVRSVRADLDRILAYLHELEAARHAERRATLAQVVTPAEPDPSQPPAPISILLVDDEALTRTFYGDLLTEHGFQVFVASSGVEGLAIARQHPVEAVVLDILMPGMSGLEVLDRLRRQDPDLPVIMLTSNASSQNALAALKLGAFDFIIKGLDHSLVVLAVHRAVRHRRATLKKREDIAPLRAPRTDAAGSEAEG